MSKGFSAVYVLVGILLVAAIAGGAYFLGRSGKPVHPAVQSTPQTIKSQPTPTSESTDSADMANWKIFQNNAVKFSLKLPQEMGTVGVGIGPPEAKDASEVIICKNCDSTVNPSKTQVIYIRTTELKYTIYKDTPFEALAKQNYEANIVNKNSTRSVVKGLEQINFAGEKAFTYTLDSSGYSGKDNGFTTYSGINKIIEVEHNGTFFVLIYTQDQTFDQILSTFRFIP